jgi:MFS family permease
LKAALFRELWAERRLLSCAFASGIGVGYLPLLVLPWTIGALIAQTGRSESWAGWIATAEIGALALASLASSRYAAERGRRRVGTIGLAAAIVANIASVFATPGSGAFLVARMVSGAGFGACVAVGNATAAGSPNPTRAFACLWFLMALWQPVVFAATPRVIAAVGLSGSYELMACAGILFLPLVGWTPDPRPATAAQTAVERSSRPRFVVLILIAFAAFWLREALVYAMSERLAAAQSLDGQQLGTILGVASILGLLGPVLAARVKAGMPSPALLCLGLSIAFATSVVMALGISARTFSAAALLAPAASFFAASLLSGLAGSFDSSGRLAALGAGTGLLSEAVGPIAGGSLVAAGGINALATSVVAIGVVGAVCGTAAAALRRHETNLS